ncbi:MAG: TIM-barrel domain-containing protein, partial [Tepidisphaeraceae bacterium]
FYSGTTNFDAMQKGGFLYQPNLKEGLIDWIGFPYTFYDAFNPGARKLFWSQINTALFSKGIDAWWMDATEPDLTPSPPTLEGQRSHMMPTAAGTASREINGYALMNSRGVYEGQRSAAPDQRVFILTRSGFAGIQRYATATWSGDTTATWTGLAKQIPAGLGFCISGLPYWTMDIGGYTMDTRFSTDNPTPEATEEWRELNTRWFQFGTFCPLTRLHGELKPREPWTFGGDNHPAYQTIVKFDRLRYRLLPYIYSLAGAMTQDAGTMMRPLVMDFTGDTQAREITDEYMFGPAFLVAPVTAYQARSRNVYLPPTTGDWYDFWTGTSTPGGQTIDAPAPYDSMPLYIRAGSIIPFGPDLQYTGEKPADPITFYVYAGADGAFTLYEDDGRTYGYEKGAFARIPIRWDEKSQTLTIGKREGSFKGMLKQRTFNVVVISKDKPVDFSFAPLPDHTVPYTGKAVKLTFEQCVKKHPLYLDASQPLEKRVNDLLKCMTLEEKISQVHADSKFSTAAVPRLGIPRRWFADGPHGVREDVGPYSWDSVGRTDDYATWMPALSALGSTWNVDLATAYGEVLGQEARARNKDVLLAPIVDIARTPLCGRIYEYLGEDPFLNTRLAVNYIEGVQSNGVAACVKHFAGNNQEVGRATINMDMDDRTLREIYLPPFEAAIKEAHAWAVMGAYTKFRGEHCAYSDYLINKLLKGEWGFPGFVMSDWGGTYSTREAVFGGLDVEMGTLVGSEDKSAYNKFFLAQPFLDGIRQGDYPVSILDDKVRRSLRVMFATGVFDRRPPGSLNTLEHRAVAQRVAEESMVLLKNETNALPLVVSNLTSVAVIGENAVRHNAAGFFGAGVKTMHEVTPLDGIEQLVGGKVNVTYSAGYSKEGGDSNLVERAVTAARQADVAIVVAGLNHSRNLDDEGWDRTNLCLPYGQDELIQRVVEANPRTIVVLVSGPAIELGPWLAQVPAVLQAHYSGMEGGHALARILFGDVNPSGRLTVTYPKKLMDSPAHALDTYPGTNGTLFYKEGLLVGYRWFDTKNIEPEFPFGFGLSYTTFEYSNLKLVPGPGTKGPIVTAEFDIANTGPRAGAEVAELYIHQDNPRLPRPLKELKGFKKVFLKPNEKQTISIPLDIRAFAFYDPAKANWVTQADDFKIQIGSSSRDIRLESNYHLP